MRLFHTYFTMCAALVQCYRITPNIFLLLANVMYDNVEGTLTTHDAMTTDLPAIVNYETCPAIYANTWGTMGFEVS